MVASTTSTGVLLLLLLQLKLPTTVIGGCTENDNGMKASKDCTQYYWCKGGVVGDVFYDCVHGELYDETQSLCVNPDNTNFKCPGLNLRDNDPESAAIVGHTTSLSGSVISEGAALNTDKWCGTTFDDMALRCAVACPNGTDEECPGSERCFADSSCGKVEAATASPSSSAPTITAQPSITPRPTDAPIVITASPTTKAPSPAPTENNNPNNHYCKNGWDGECGKPCPT